MRLAITLFIAASLIRAQSTSSQSSVDLVLDQLKSSNWTERSAGFEEAVTLIGAHRHSRHDDELRVGLINLS